MGQPNPWTTLPETDREHLGAVGAAPAVRVRLEQSTGQLGGHAVKPDELADERTGDVEVSRAYRSRGQNAGICLGLGLEGVVSLIITEMNSRMLWQRSWYSSVPRYRRSMIIVIMEVNGPADRAVIEVQFIERHQVPTPVLARYKLKNSTTRTRHGPDTDKVRARCRVRAKFHYTDTDTNPTQTGHGQNPRTLSGTS